MTVVIPPKYVKSVLRTLEKNGFLGFLVGGCVRDAYMGKRPADWDICTNALPNEILSIFENSKPTGLRHGTVTVFVGRRQIEVTTFRKDGGYTDHRHPDNVSFLANLTDDLERRDFTMNAIALPLTGLVVDPFNGREDINKRLIRCVGDPMRRYEEDALRMFRALRFSARIGFDIDTETADSIYSQSHLAASLAPERINQEMEKILMSDNPGVMGRLLRYGLLDHLILRPRATCDLRRIRLLPKNRQQRWSALCAALTQRGIVEDSERFLKALRLDNSTIYNCSKAVALERDGLAETKTDWKRMIYRNGIEICLCAAAAGDMTGPNRNIRFVKNVIKSGECFSLSRLAVSGDDLLQHGFQGPELGQALNSLLELVILHPELNEKSLLLSMLPR